MVTDSVKRLASYRFHSNAFKRYPIEKFVGCRQRKNENASRNWTLNGLENREKDV